MSVFVAPLKMLDKKPPHGSPCNSCGLCCYATLCHLARSIFHREAGPCPALGFDANGNSFCGVVADPTKYAPDKVTQHGLAEMTQAALTIVASGLGCDARFNGEWTNREFHKKCDAWDRTDAYIDAKKKWGLRL